MKTKNRQAKLSSRIADWAATIDTRNPYSTKTTQRKENGGYHKPGSNKK